MNQPMNHEFNKQKPKSEFKTIGQQRFQNQGKNTVSSIIGGYKSAVTKHARRMGFEFAWQSRFGIILYEQTGITNVLHDISSTIRRNGKTTN